MTRIATHRTQRGVAAIEMGLLLVPLLFFVFAGTELGRALYSYNTVVKAARGGARYLSMQSAGSGHAVAKCLVVYGNAGCSGNPLVPGLASGNVVITENRAVASCIAAGQCYGSIDLVTVTVTGYRFQSFMPPLLPDTMRSFGFADISATMRQAVS